MQRQNHRHRQSQSTGIQRWRPFPDGLKTPMAHYKRLPNSANRAVKPRLKIKHSKQNNCHAIFKNIRTFISVLGTYCFLYNIATTPVAQLPRPDQLSIGHLFVPDAAEGGNYRQYALIISIKPPPGTHITGNKEASVTIPKPDSGLSPRPADRSHTNTDSKNQRYRHRRW